MRVARNYYPQCPEALIITLARNGDRDAFEELVRRRQSSVRNLMRRFCSDTSLADDLAQQVFLKLWTTMKTLKNVEAFGGWLKQIALSIWLQHLRKQDALRDADEYEGTERIVSDNPGEIMDLDSALSVLAPMVRSCVVLSYQEGMSHEEISKAMKMPLGTVKSHIRRGTEKLRQLLAAYREDEGQEYQTKEEQS